MPHPARCCGVRVAVGVVVSFPNRMRRDDVIVFDSTLDVLGVGGFEVLQTAHACACL